MKAEEIENYLVKNYGYCRHNPKKFEKALNETAKIFELDPFSLFQFIVENRQIVGFYTHSYGFHTSYGRQIVDTFKNNFNN